MEMLTERQKEKLDALMEMDVDQHMRWRREVEDAQTMRNEHRLWMVTDARLRWAPLALVAAELLIVAAIALRIST